MTSFNIDFDRATYTMTVGFNKDIPATNCQLVTDAAATLAALGITGGRVLFITGPASVPVAFVIAHVVVHLFGAVAVFDPKLAGFVVAVSHDPAFAVGDLIQPGV